MRRPPSHFTKLQTNLADYPDTYVQVRIDGGKKERTLFVLSSCNPEWNDVLELWVESSRGMRVANIFYSEVTEDSIIHADVCDVFLFKLMGSMSVRVGDVIDLVYGAGGE